MDDFALCEQSFSFHPDSVPFTTLFDRDPLASCDNDIGALSPIGASTSSAFSFTPLDSNEKESFDVAAAAATFTETEFIGLNGKPIHIPTVVKPFTFDELSPEFEVRVTQRICDLGNLINSIGNDEAKYQQAIDMWTHIYDNLLTYFHAYDECHRYSVKFFSQYGIRANRINTNVKPYVPAIGKQLYNENLLCTARSKFEANQVRASYSKYNENTRKMDITYISVAQAMTRAFPTGTTLVQDDLFCAEEGRGGRDIQQDQK